MQLATRADWPEVTGASSRNAYEAILCYETSTRRYAIESTVSRKHIYHRTENMGSTIFLVDFKMSLFLFRKRELVCVCVCLEISKEPKIARSKGL